MQIVRRLSIAISLLAITAWSGASQASFASLDTSFGTNGIAAGGAPGAGSIDTDSMGRIYALMLNGSSYLVARFDADGALDETFGNLGFATIAPFAPSANGTNVQLVAIAVDEANDNVILAGYNGLQGGKQAMAVGRYDFSGNRVTTFGSAANGYVVNSAANDSFLYAVDVAADGTIVAAGEHFASISPGIVRDAAVVRMSSTGTMDAGFGTAGVKIVDLGTVCDFPRSVALDSDGRVLVGAMLGSVCATAQAGVARLATDGSPDATFSMDGVTLLGVSATSVVRLLVPQTDGSVVALAARASDEFAEPNQLTVTQLNEDGSQASSASAGFPGAVQGFLGKGTFAAQSDGKLVGAAVVIVNCCEQIRLYRLTGCDKLTATGGTCAGGGGGGGGGGGSPTAPSLLVLLIMAGVRRRLLAAGWPPGEPVL